LLHEAAESVEREVCAADEAERRGEAPQAADDEGDDHVPQNRIERRRVHGHAAERGEAADARSRGGVTNTDAGLRLVAMATTLHEAAQAAQRLDPRPCHAIRAE